MTITTEPVPIPYDGDDVTVDFPVTFKYFAKADIKATLRDEDGNETVWVLNTDYTLTDAGDTGTLTAIVAPATGEKLVIEIDPDNTQGSSLPLGGKFPSTTVEQALDKAAQRDARNQRLWDRALRVPTTDENDGADLELPIDTDRANKFLKFDANGKPTSASGTGEVGNTLSDTLNAAGNPITNLPYLNLTEQSSSPSTPATGKINVYAKTDGLFYYKDDAGNEIVLSDNGSPNLAFNGDFQSWQDALSQATIADGAYFGDVFRYNKVGAMVHTVSFDTDVPTVAQSGHLSAGSALIDCTTVDTSLASTDLCTATLYIEGYEYRHIAQRAFAIGFWVKATKTGTYCVAIRNSGNDRSYVAEYTVDAANTWEYKIVRVSAPPSAGTWSYTNGVGLKISWTLAAGSSFQTTAGAWNTGNFLSTSNQVNACDDTGNNFRISQVVVMRGINPVPFKSLPFAELLRRAYRYIWKVGPVVNGVLATGWAKTTSVAEVFVNLPVPMMGTISLSVTANDDFSIHYANTSVQTASGSAPAITQATPHVVGISFTASAASLTAGDGVGVKLYSNGDEELKLTSRWS